MPKKISKLAVAVTKRMFSEEKDRAACGVAAMVRLPKVENGVLTKPNPTHTMIQQGLEVLNKFNYRTGYNPIYKVHDGSGLRISLSTKFFNHMLQQGEFKATKDTSLTGLKLKEGHFGIGHYFLPKNPKELLQQQNLIEECALKEGLTLLGWRNMDQATRPEVLSEKAQSNLPAIRQALFIAIQDSLALEPALHKLSQKILSTAPQTDIMSQSSESIVYKGTIPPKLLNKFYPDLTSPFFETLFVLLHGRYSTNTASLWSNTQPCPFFWAHNGELNSAPANLRELQAELKAYGLNPIAPKRTSSDSIQFDLDMFHQKLMHEAPLHEAFVRLMPPQISSSDSPEVRAMLSYFRRLRTPYNGPAFGVAFHEGHLIAKLDDGGLRPAHFCIIEDASGERELHAASDSYMVAPPGGKIIQKGHLASGEMLLVTPYGEILHTKKILEDIATRYQKINPHHFQTLQKSTTEALITPIPKQPQIPLTHDDLQRKLFASGWDSETVTQILRPMAEDGEELVAAMGNDTNPLYSKEIPSHLSHFMGQDWVQVSAPSRDYLREMLEFVMSTWIGPIPAPHARKQVELPCPILQPNELHAIQHHETLKSELIQICFPRPQDPAPSPLMAKKYLEEALKNMLTTIESILQKNEVDCFILTDQNLSKDQISIPDVLAIAAVKHYLQEHHLTRKISLLVDTFQSATPHQIVTLLALGAQAVYPRAAYEKLAAIYQDTLDAHQSKYVSALKKSLLKSMGILGITDVNNYINGRFLTVLGLQLDDDPTDQLSLGKLFSGLSSPLGGFHLGDIALEHIKRHTDAFLPLHDFTRLPRSGFFMPEHDGVKHGFGPEVVNATAEWMQSEDVIAKTFQLDEMLSRSGVHGYANDKEAFTPERGFLDSRKKNEGFPKGLYPVAYLERFKPSEAFLKMSQTLDDYKRKHPTSLRDYLTFKKSTAQSLIEVQSQLSIRKVICTGGMSQGALTVSSENTPEILGAHETLTRAMNSVHAKSGSGEGGQQLDDLKNPLFTSGISQAASGRFAFSAEQLLAGVYNEFGELEVELEIKVGQGAKPGQGGKMPGQKVIVRFAALRGGLPGIELASPPNQYTLQSIEEFDEFRHAILRVNPNIKLCVKIVSKVGTGHVAIGLAKAGVQTINIASNSGGTGAAEQSSIKFAGLPSELGLREADLALRKAGLRELVTLCVSGGIKTADDVMLLAALGAERFEIGTYALMLLGCRMLRTCNKSCQPGVTMDGHLFKGQQITVERFIVNLASEIQMKLQALGIPSLEALRGRTDLLEVISPEIEARYQFSALLKRIELPEKPSPELLKEARENFAASLIHSTEDALVKEIETFLAKHPSGTYVSKPIELTTDDRSFGARIAGAFTHHLRENPNARIILNTKGVGGQSFAFVMPKGMSIHHTGSVQDGCGQSIDGELVIKTPKIEGYKAHENMLVGNIALYGARGKAYINGRAANRFCPVGQGVEAVVEGTLDRACQMNLSSTVLILGPTGSNLCAGASGGIVFVYSKKDTLQPASAVRLASTEERKPYLIAIEKMLRDHLEKTGSELANTILSEGINPEDFQVLIPKTLDKINSFQSVIDIIKTYQLRKTDMTLGMQVWFDEKVISLIACRLPCSLDELNQLHHLTAPSKRRVLSLPVHEQLMDFINSVTREKNPKAPAFEPKPTIVDIQPVEVRLESVTGTLDVLLKDALTEINDYVSKLTHDAAGCSGCRSQSCAGGEEVNTGCPSGKAIHTINNRLKRIGAIQDGRLSPRQWATLRQAFDIQIETTPFIAYTGAACPAPCQDACTEGIPSPGNPNPLRQGKPFGEAVHIKDIEYWLFQIGRAFGWFDGAKVWSKEEKEQVFGGEDNFKAYLGAIQRFKPPFQRPLHTIDKELIIIGSGPAGMQMAYLALKEGVRVRMYEASDTPGGLLTHGIPAHKFDKSYIHEDFMRLKAMGLELNLYSKVQFNGRDYRVHGRTIASIDNKNQFIAVCVGAGQPKELPKKMMETLPLSSKIKIVQACDFLVKTNQLATFLKEHPELSHHEKSALISLKLGAMDPRGKKVAVIGGGDTAQDVVRWVARYFNQGKREHCGLEVLVRGYQPEARGITDGYPYPSRAPTSENKLRGEELEYVQGKINQLVEPQKITMTSLGKLTLEIKEAMFKHHREISNHSAEALKLFSELPREMRPLDPEKTVIRRIEDLDLIICALGFQGRESIPLVKNLQETDAPRIYLVGDVAGTEAQIIIGAQASANKTWHGQLRKDMELGVTPASSWARPRLFQPSSEGVSPKKEKVTAVLREIQMN